MKIDDQFLILPNGHSLCYRSYGLEADTPLILVVGLGLQLVYWPQPLIDGLVSQGFRVITMDNRDSGKSFFTDATPPTIIQQLFRKPTDGYDLGDMASDVLGLMDALELESAHVLGMSMGGMIAQTLASRHPERVTTLTSVFSTTGSLKVGQPAYKAILQLIRRPPRTQQEGVQSYIDMMRLIGSSLEWNESELRNYAAQAWERGGGDRNNLGTARQVGAIINSGDRTAELQRIRCPSLVIHGDQDRMVASSGGYATAAAIADARFVVLPGMGHAIPLPLVDILINLLVGHMRPN